MAHHAPGFLQIVAERLDFDAVLQVVVKKAGSLTPASGVVIELVEGDEMVYRAVAGSATGSGARILGVDSPGRSGGLISGVTSVKGPGAGSVTVPVQARLERLIATRKSSWSWLRRKVRPS